LRFYYKIPCSIHIAYLPSVLIGAFAQGLFAEAVISTNRAVDSTVSEVGQETPYNSLPKFVKKDFNIVAVAKYSDKNNPGNYIAGFIDKSGNFVIKPKFRDFYEGLAPVKAKENGLLLSAQDHQRLILHILISTCKKY